MLFWTFFKDFEKESFKAFRSDFKQCRRFLPILRIFYKVHRRNDQEQCTIYQTFDSLFSEYQQVNTLLL